MIFFTKNSIFSGMVFFYKLTRNPNLTKFFILFIFFFFLGGGGVKGGGRVSVRA